MTCDSVLCADICVCEARFLAVCYSREGRELDGATIHVACLLYCVKLTTPQGLILRAASDLDADVR